LGATEDRVLGTLDFERALREGRRAFQPGLLAAAHRGIVYIDEVNLLADHLVDVLLDAAASGVNVVEREGIEASHPARFILIGTMNPEEGELRPQLLDRFGLMVRVAAGREPIERSEIVRRRLAFEASPLEFAAAWESEQAALRSQIARAQALLPEVVLHDELLITISRLCCDFDVDGLRADIVMVKTACALAALEDCRQVSLDHVRTAAELVLPHRRRRRPFEQTGLDRNQLEQSLNQESDPRPASPPERSTAESAIDEESSSWPGDREPNAADSKPNEGQPAQLFGVAPSKPARPIELAQAVRKPAQAPGRRNAAQVAGRGAYVRAIPDEAPQELAIDATLRAAAIRGGWNGERLAVERTDLHRKYRAGRSASLVLFLVDASGSMAARRRMEAVKGAVLSLLLDAYQQRDRVAVIGFRGSQAQVLLEPTSSVEQAEAALRTLPTGGRTPLAHALVLAGELLERARATDPNLVPLCVLLTDGKANAPLPGTSGDACQQAFAAARQLANAKVPALVLDTDVGIVRVGQAQELAAALAAEYLLLEDLTSDSVLLQIQARKAAV
jgi:magnesium chelatase subunit D